MRTWYQQILLRQNSYGNASIKSYTGGLLILYQLMHQSSHCVALFRVILKTKLVLYNQLSQVILFDESFNFKQHISKTCRCCFYHIRDLRRIRRFVSLSVAKTTATALVSSRLDYCNSLLYNTANKDIARLQRVQNCLARVVTRSPRFSSSVPLLKSLHWLPVHYRNIFKICTISYQALASKQPTYINSMLTPARNSRELRSTSSNPLSLGLRRKLGPELSRLLHQLCGIRFLSVSNRKVI